MPPTTGTEPTPDPLVAALALADEEGLAAVSPGAVAARIGVQERSLRQDLPDREALLDGLVDRVVGEFHVPQPGRPWREELQRRSVTARATLLRHRWAVGLAASRRSAGPSTLRHHEAVLVCLRGAGLSPAAAGHAATLLDAQLYGFVLQEPRPSPTVDAQFDITLDLVLDAVAGLIAEAGTTAPAVQETETPEPVPVLAPVLGVDGCRAGWVGALLVPGAPRPRVVVAPTIAELVETVRAEVDLRVVGIDIPIGLPDDTLRQADALARTALPGRASTVFTTLTRDAYAQPTRAEADRVNRGLTGQGVGAQAFGLRDKIVEVDAWVRSRPTVEVLEVHPEVSFAAMTGAPVSDRKTTETGRAARLAALAAAGIPRPSVLSGSGYGADDVLDACAVAWTAARRVAGLSHSLPDRPEVFSDGIEAAIHV